MQAYFKGNKGAVSYRGVAFIDETPVQVSPGWFERATNPNITQKRAAKRKAPKPPVALSDTVEGEG